MIALVIAVAQIFIAGIAAARLLDPTITPRRLLGTAYLLGSGICALVLLALSAIGIRWSVLSFTSAYAIVAIALWVPILRFAPLTLPSPRRGEGTAVAIDLCTVILLIGHGVYAMLVRGAEWDFWAIWGLKARVFFEHGGIDWAFLQHPYNAFAHPDYPPLVPLQYAQIAILKGGWNEHWLGLLTTFFGAALVLVLRDFFEEEVGRPAIAALATFAVASMSFGVVGMADTPLIAFATAALLTIRRGNLPLGSVLLGFAALTKNEGLALIVAAAVALWITRRSAVLRLWPAALIAAPWLILRAVHAIPTKVVSGDLADRAARSIERIPELARLLIEYPPEQPLFWAAIAIALAVHVRELRRERFVLIAVLLQLAFYLAVYLGTPYDFRWHVESSWQRLLQHVAVPLAFVALSFLGKEFTRAR